MTPAVDRSRTLLGIIVALVVIDGVFALMLALPKGSLLYAARWASAEIMPFLRPGDGSN